MLSPTLDTLRLFLHVMAASIWVGGQIVLGALVPRLRAISPTATKTAARGFAVVAWPAYAVVIVTGLWNLADIDVANTSTAYQITIFVKVLLAVASGAAAAAHSAAQSRVVIAVGGAVGVLAAIGAMFVGYLLTKRGVMATNAGRAAVIGAAMGLLVAGCTGDDNGEESGGPVSTAPAADDDLPGAEQTPFCLGMSDIASRVNTDPPADLNAYLVAEYERLAPVVPPGVASDFALVLADLGGDASAVSLPQAAASAPTTGTVTRVFDEEGYLPDEEPALRLNTYIAANCFGTQSNPGPPATEPLTELPATTAG